MTEYFDARTRFYLENQVDIDTWAALRDDTATAAVRWLDSLAEFIDEMALTLTPAPLRFPIRGNLGHGLALPEWPGDEDGPTVCVGLAWYRREALADAYAGKVKPYVGVWAAPGQGSPDPLVAQLREAGLTGRAWSTPTGSWLAWRWLPVGGRWWEDLDTEGDRLGSELAAVWAQASPVITQAMATRPSKSERAGGLLEPLD